MNKLILDILENVGTKIPQLKETETELSAKALELLQELETQIPEQYHDEIEAVMFQVFQLAEQGGFEVGMKYMSKLLLECLS